MKHSQEEYEKAKKYVLKNIIPNRTYSKNFDKSVCYEIEKHLATRKFYDHCKTFNAHGCFEILAVINKGKIPLDILDDYVKFNACSFYELTMIRRKYYNKMSSFSRTALDGVSFLTEEEEKQELLGGEDEEFFIKQINNIYKNDIIRY